MKDIKIYSVVTAGYWSFTITDGALRMLVLLYFHTLGYTPFQLATLFILYELMGIVTNLIGGWFASQFGLRLTLYAGLLTQIFSLTILSLLDPNWSQQLSMIFVLCMQGLSGIAKDLSKMSSKSSIKLVTSTNSKSTLFRWTALLTGSKNTLKGLGFFVGGLLLNHTGFQDSLLLMAGCLSLILIFTMFALPKSFGEGLIKTKLSSILSKTPSINYLSSARSLLFGARDIWFVVGLPVFLYDVLKWNFESIGTFFACWIIGYGIIQSLTPHIIKQSNKGYTKEITSTRSWTLGLSFLSLMLSIAIYIGISPLIITLLGLTLFGAVFAINSSLHSFLILALTKTDEVALNVGFYYMANAIGRFFGTLLSGIIYQEAGLSGCLAVSAVMIGFSGYLINLLGEIEKIK